MFQFSQPQREQLTKLGSSPRFTRLHTPVRDKNSNNVINKDKKRTEVKSVIQCDLLDNLTNRAWASGQGQTDETALANALKNADEAARPKTAAQIALENEQLKKELAAREKVDESESTEK